jgi:hypothetical protein
MYWLELTYFFPSFLPCDWVLAQSKRPNGVWNFPLPLSIPEDGRDPVSEMCLERTKMMDVQNNSHVYRHFIAAWPGKRHCSHHCQVAKFGSKWVGHIANMGVMRRHTKWSEKAEGKRPLGRCGQDNIKLELKEAWSDGVGLFLSWVLRNHSLRAWVYS